MLDDGSAPKDDDDAVKLLRRKLGVDPGVDVVIPFGVLCELLRIASESIIAIRNLTVLADNIRCDGDDLFRRLNSAVEKIG
jgi:hypothetical protein